MVDGVIAAGRRRRRPDAADQVRARQGAGAAACSPIVVVNKVDRPDARAARSARRGVRPVRRARRQRRAARFPDALRLGPPGLGRTDSSTVARKDLAPLFDLICRHVPAPDGRCRRPVHDAASTLRDRDNFLGRILTGRIEQGIAQRQHADQGAARATATVVETGRADQAAGLPRPRARAGREARGGRHHRHRRPDRRRPSPTPSRDPTVTEPLHAMPIDPPTLAMTFARQRQPAGRPRRQQGHVAA